MAVNDQGKSTSAAARRWFFGANVTIVILLLLFMVCAANFIGKKYNYRRDMSGGFTSHRLSDRTKKVIEKLDAPVRITTVYTSDKPALDRRKYAQDLEDLLEEMQQYSGRIKVDNLRSGRQQVELRDRLKQQVGTAGQEYAVAIEQARDAWKKVEDALEPMRQQIDGLFSGDTWASRFSILKNVSNSIKKDVEAIGEASKEVEKLVLGEGIPRYQEANDRIKTVSGDLKTHLEEARKSFDELNSLMELLSSDDATFARTTTEKGMELTAHVSRLRQIIGDAKDAAVPDEPVAVLTEFADQANKTAQWLVAEAARIGSFVKDHPAIQQHPQWTIQLRDGIFVQSLTMEDLPAELAAQLSANAQEIRALVSRQVPRDQLQTTIRTVRSRALPPVEQLSRVYVENMVAILGDGRTIDAASRQFIQAAATGGTIKDMIDTLTGVETAIAALPELKSGDVAQGIQDDNIVVIEAGEGKDSKVKVVKFDEVWPISASRWSTPGEDDEQRRVFDGDTAISGALLSMQNEKPFATVIFVGYETEPAPQMRQFGARPRTGQIPLAGLTTLKERLKQANFITKDWNLAGEGPEGEKPAAEEGTEPIYVLLPPPEPEMPNFMNQQPAPSFGDAHLARVREALKDGGKAIFLAMWLPSDPRLPPVEYPYNQLLTEDWGMRAATDRRVIRALIDEKEPDKFQINVSQWVHMQLSFFTGQPIGDPLKNRRVLMFNVCPVVRTEGDPPQDVKIETVLEVPEGAREFYAEPDVMRIMMAFDRAKPEGTFTMSEKAEVPPFPVILAAENTAGKSRIVTMGSGFSFRDDFLGSPVMRIEGKNGALVPGPAPTEEIDLFMNSVYWLSGRENLIGSGPADVPLVGPIRPEAKDRLFWFLALPWAVVMLLTGGVVWMVRRK